MNLQVVFPVQTYPDGNAPTIAPYAAAVGRRLEAEINVLVHAVEFPRVSSYFGSTLADVPAMVADAQAKCRDRGATLRQALEAECARSHVPLRFTEVTSFPHMFGDAVARHARYHDLVVVGLAEGDSTHAGVAEAAIFGSGKPALLVPEGVPAGSFERPMIAWDGSRAAARAVADARDFLNGAQAVTVVSVVDEKPISGKHPAGRLADYLSRRAISATVAEVQGGNRPIAAALQEHAMEIGADMIVMGAFGHSRIRDFVLGGATRGILSDLRMPVLLSH